MKPAVNNIIYNCIRESFFSLFFVAVYLLGLSSPGGKEGSNSISNSIQTTPIQRTTARKRERERDAPE